MTELAPDTAEPAAPDKQTVIAAVFHAAREAEQAYGFSPGSYTATALAATAAARDIVVAYLNQPEPENAESSAPGNVAQGPK